MSFASITLFDSILFAILFLFILYGIWMGCQKQLAFIIALIGSYAASAQYAGDVMPYLNHFIESPKIIFGGLFIILLITSTLLLKLLGFLLSKIIQVTIVGWFDRFFLGAPLALLKGAALVVVVIMFLAATLAPADQFFQKSLTTPYLEQGIEKVREVIKDPQIREDLKPLKAVEPGEQKEPEEQKDVPPHSQQIQQIQQDQQVENPQGLQEAPQVQELQEFEEDQGFQQDFQNPQLPPESEGSPQMQEAQFPQNSEEAQDLQQLQLQDNSASSTEVMTY